MKKTAHPKQLNLRVDPDLAKVLHFDRRDLHSNHWGYLSYSQYKLLNKLRQIRAIYFLLSFIAGISVEIYGFTIYDFDSVGAIPFPCFFLFVLFFTLGMMFLTYSDFRDISRDMKEAKVEVVEGLIHREISPGRPTSTRYIVIDQQKFKVSASIYDAFKDNYTYTLFYIPHMHKIIAAISLELLR